MRGELEAPGEDISRLQGLSPEGHRPYLEESIYAFAEPVSMDRLRELVEIAEPLAREAAGPAGVPVDEPLLDLPWGSSVAVRLDYGGRRLHGKRPGTSRSLVPEDVRLELTPRNDRHAEPPRGPLGGGIRGRGV